MEENRLLLLQTLNSAQELSPSADQLSAEQVNRLAEKLGLNPQETLRVLEDFRQQHLVELRWGKVSITSEGKSALRPSGSGTPAVHLEKGAVYLGAGAQIGAGAAIGKKARGRATITRGDLPPEAMAMIANLIAAQQHLISAATTLPAEVREDASKLADETDAIQHALQNPGAGKPGLEQRLDRAKGLLDKLGGITTAAAALGPALNLLKPVFAWVSTLL
jgi:hypothetical protein